MAARKLRVCLAERLEEEWQEVCCDALTGIDDCHLDMVIAHAAYGRCHPTTRAGEFDSIREQVPEHLLESSRIGADHRPVWINVHVQRDPLGVRRGPHALNRLAQYSLDRCGRGLEPHLSPSNARYV